MGARAHSPIPPRHAGGRSPKAVRRGRAWPRCRVVHDNTSHRIRPGHAPGPRPPRLGGHANFQPPGRQRARAGGAIQPSVREPQRIPRSGERAHPHFCEEASAREMSIPPGMPPVARRRRRREDRARRPPVRACARSAQAALESQSSPPQHQSVPAHPRKKKRGRRKNGGNSPRPRPSNCKRNPSVRAARPPPRLDFESRAPGPLPSGRVPLGTPSPPLLAAALLPEPPWTGPAGPHRLLPNCHSGGGAPPGAPPPHRAPPPGGRASFTAEPAPLLPRSSES